MTVISQQNGTFSPKTSLAGPRPVRKLQIFENESPIPAQIRDKEEIEQFFKVFKNVFVPYAGTDVHTSHSLLAFLLSLSKLSPTKSGLLLNMKQTIFGGIVDIVERFDPVFDIETNSENVSESVKKSFRDFITNEIQFYGINNKPLDVRSFGTSVWEMVRRAGFIFLEIVDTTILGVTHTDVYMHHPISTLFVLTANKEPKMVGISPVWTVDYIRKHEPQLVPVYPRKIKQGNTIRTMIMVGQGNEPWYTYPEDISTMFHQYAEFQQAEYVTKQTHNKFMGEVFIEVENENPDTYGGPDKQEDPVKELRDKLNEEHSNMGLEPTSIIVSTRPFGAKQAFVFQFAPNNNADWYQKMAEWSSDYIIPANSWSKRLMGINEASGLSTNVFIDEFAVKDVITIQPNQAFIDQIINQIIFNVAENRGKEFEKYSIKFSSPFRKMLEDAKNSDNAEPSDPI